MLREDDEERRRMKEDDKDCRGLRDRKMRRSGGDRDRKLGRDGKCLGAVLVLLKGFLRILKQLCVCIEITASTCVRRQPVTLEKGSGPSSCVSAIRRTP